MVAADRVEVMLFTGGGVQVYLRSGFKSAELCRFDVGSVMQLFVLDTFSNEQEVEAALITAEHMLLLQTHTENTVRFLHCSNYNRLHPHMKLNTTTNLQEEKIAVLP